MTIRELLAALAALEDGDDPPPGHSPLTWERLIRRELRRRRNLLHNGKAGSRRLPAESRRRLRAARQRRAGAQRVPAAKQGARELPEAT
jgi:hypothetical protein